MLSHDVMTVLIENSICNHCEIRPVCITFNFVNKMTRLGTQRQKRPRKLKDNKALKITSCDHICTTY